MSKILFFLFGLPIIMVSMVGQFITDFLVDSTVVTVTNNGTEIVMTQEQSNSVKELIKGLLWESRDVPTIFVTTDEMARKDMESGYYIDLKFDGDVSYNEYEFDELAFKVEKDLNYICFMRANDGSFDGRCLYFELSRDMSELYSYIDNISSVKETNINTQDATKEEQKEETTAEDKKEEEKVIEEKVNTKEENTKEEIAEDKVEIESKVTDENKTEKEEKKD